MILGIGNDICNIARIAETRAKFGQRFVSRCFGEGERQELARLQDAKFTASLAKRFAAKEAFVKALQTGFSSGLGWAEIEVLHYESGCPYIRLAGRTADFATTVGVKKIWLSLADDYPFAQAFVVIEG